MRISVVNLTHGLLSDAEVIAAIRAINRQINEDFMPYWNIGGTLRLEGCSTDELEVDNPQDLQGEAIVYIWDKSDVPNALGYHEANFRGIPYGFVFVDIATEVGENWTVTFSHEVLELLGDRQANSFPGISAAKCITGMRCVTPYKMKPTKSTASKYRILSCPFILPKRLNRVAAMTF